jgi:hypothetical protein
MNTDMKWFALAFMFIIGIPMVGFTFDQYQKNQCRIEAIKVGMDPDKIAQVCK